MVASILKIVITQNTNYNNLVGFPKSDHIYLLHIVPNPAVSISPPGPIQEAIIGSSQWTLFLTRSRLLFYFLFRIRSIYFRNIYRLQMALGV